MLFLVHHVILSPKEKIKLSAKKKKTVAFPKSKSLPKEMRDYVM